MERQPNDAGFDAARLQRIATHFERFYIEPAKIAGCQVAIGRHGHLAYSASLGHRDRERDVPLGDDTIFRIYSMTKPITSIALMQLMEQSLFQLDDPVARFFPSWRQHQVWVSGTVEGGDMITEPAHRPVSFRDLLTHTSGLTYGGVLPGMGDQHPVDAVYRAAQVRSPGVPTTMAAFMDKLAHVPLRFQPGTAYMYSLATDACGALVEQISGMAFADYLDAHILGPLGMVDTAFQVSPDKTGRFAANYARTPDKTTVLFDDPTTSAYTRPPAFVSGGGGLTGTVEDYARFCEMLRRGGRARWRTDHRTAHTAADANEPPARRQGSGRARRRDAHAARQRRRRVWPGVRIDDRSGRNRRAQSRRFLLGRRGLDGILGRSDRGPVGSVHDPADAIDRVRLPRPTAQSGLQRDH